MSIYGSIGLTGRIITTFLQNVLDYNSTTKKKQKKNGRFILVYVLKRPNEEDGMKVISRSDSGLRLLCIVGSGVSHSSILHRFLVVFRSDVFAGQFITNMKKISFWQCEQLPHPAGQMKTTKSGQHFDYLCFWFRSGFTVETHTWTDLTQPTFESTWSFLSG